MKEETPDEKDDSIKTTTTNLEAAGSSSSKPEIKDEPVDDVKETKPTPSKDPLAEAMNEVSTLKNNRLQIISNKTNKSHQSKPEIVDKFLVWFYSCSLNKTSKQYSFWHILVWFLVILISDGSSAKHLDQAKMFWP